MAFPLVANPLLAAGTFGALGCKAAFSLSSDPSIQGLGNVCALCTMLAGMWVGEVPALLSF